jgi:carbonic anhydrase
MIRPNPITSWQPEIKTPQIDPGAFVDPTAVLIGEVIIQAGVYVGPLAVLRADEGAPIIIGEGSNVQDGVIIHGLKGSSVEVGRNCCLAHGAVIHGPCSIGEETFVGFRAILLKANIGQGCFIGHNAQILGLTLPEKRFVPEGLVLKQDGRLDCCPEITPEQNHFTRDVLEVNRELTEGYRRIKS